MRGECIMNCFVNGYAYCHLADVLFGFEAYQHTYIQVGPYVYALPR